MLKKKFFAKALAFALVMGTVSVYGSGVVAPISIVQATELAKTTITVDYANYTATIKTTNDTDTYVFLEVLKDQAGTKVASTYCCAVGAIDGGKGAVIDLSFLKAAKDQYIRSYGNTLDSKGAYVYSDITKIVAQPAKLSIKYDASKGLVDGKTKEAIKIEDYEFKSLYGSTWADLEADSLKGMEITGNTIVLRKKAVDNTDSTKGVPASAEVKVKIPAIPKAPKAKIDYVKGTISFGKGTEYIKLGTAAISDGDTWTKNGDTKSLTTADLLKKLNVSADDQKAKDTTIVVRTAKTDKKAASALSFVTITKKAEIQNTAATGDNPNGGTVAYTGTDVDESVKMTWENTTKGISLKAEKAPFQYYDATKKDWKTIAVGKAVEVKLKDKAELKVRVAGKKATKTENGAFASGEVSLTCKILPAKITVTADKTEITTTGTATINLSYEMTDGNKETLTLESGDSRVPTWSLSDTTVGSIANNTLSLNDLPAGTSKTVTVTAKSGDVEGKVEIKIEIPKTDS